MDDIIIFSTSWEMHLGHFAVVFERIAHAHLTLNLRKFVFANAELDFGGHHIMLTAIQPLVQKVEAVLKFPRPRNRKQVQSLLGIAGYYREYLPHYSELTLPFTDLLKKNKHFVFSDVCERAFLDLKSRLASQLILRSPDYSKQFCLAVDASQGAVGGCFFQTSNGAEHPVCYLSRKLNKHKIHYSTIEKKALALVSAVRACSVYFGNSPVIVFSDPSPLEFIDSMANSNQKLLRWKLELQQYNL